MKNYKFYIGVIGLMLLLFLTSSCSFKKDDLDGSVIYTTVYPINYLANYLYGNHAQISSIYPLDCDIETYKLTQKQINEYAKADLFIYNGLNEEKETAKTLLNKNGNLLIIDVSYGLTLKNNITELWLSPNNFLMLAKNIKDNLIADLINRSTIEEVEKNYKDFEEKISLMDASLHALGKSAKENDKNLIVVSNNTFKYLENYGFEILSLEDAENLKEVKLNVIKNNFKSKKYKYLLVADTDVDKEIVVDLVDNYKATTVEVDTLTMSLTDDYFEIMTKYIENLKNIVS